MSRKTVTAGAMPPLPPIRSWADLIACLHAAYGEIVTRIDEGDSEGARAVAVVTRLLLEHGPDSPEFLAQCAIDHARAASEGGA